MGNQISRAGSAEDGLNLPPATPAVNVSVIKGNNSPLQRLRAW